MRLIRGERFLQALIEDNTYRGLYRNIQAGFPGTKKRQHATGEVTISQMAYMPYHEEKALQVDAQVQSHGHPYQPTIQFFEIQYEPNATGANATFKGTDNKDYYILPIKLGATNVKVRCTCLDFFYRFATFNFQDNSLYGPRPPAYQKTSNRPPVNPNRIPGICKHVVALVLELERTGLVAR